MITNEIQGLINSSVCHRPLLLALIIRRQFIKPFLLLSETQKSDTLIGKNI